jgi:RNA polymerase sigma-70 factor (ECF subfamily)
MKPQTVGQPERNAADDAQLLDAVRRFLAGDKDAFEKAAPLAGRIAFHLALRSVHDEELAEEIAQESLTRLYARAKEISDVKAFPSWFYRMVLNLITDHFRKRTRKDKFCSSLEELQRMEAADRAKRLSDVERAELSNSLNYALAQLEEGQRQVFILKEVEKMSHAEISRILEIPEGTVWSRLSYARKKLREILIKEGYHP